MASAKLRWGILGVAKINDRLLPAFRESQRGQLIAIASRSDDRARSAAVGNNIPKWFGTYEAMLADSEVDAVYIPLPNHLHDAWTRRAADAGKHVLCEKPLTPDHRSASELVKYCASRGVCLMDGFMWPHHPRTAAIRKQLDAGTIGRVLQAKASFTFPLSMDPNNIRLQSETGGGSLLDVGCYPVFGIRWAFGEEPVRVFATAQYAHGVDVAMSAIVWFADGRTASFDCGFTMPLRQQMEIVGSLGVLTIPQMWLPDEHAAYELSVGESTQQMTCPCRSQIACMLDEFAAAIQEKRPARPGVGHAAATLCVLDALAISARENRVVEV